MATKNKTTISGPPSQSKNGGNGGGGSGGVPPTTGIKKEFKESTTRIGDSQKIKLNKETHEKFNRLISRTKERQKKLETPEKVLVDSRGNAIPLKKGEYLTGSKDGRWVQVRDKDGKVTGMRIDGSHSSKTHSDPRSLQPHAHVPGITNLDGTPWLLIK